MTPESAAEQNVPGRARVGVRHDAAHLFNLGGIDLTARLFGRSHIERFIPHRGRCSLLDAIVWISSDSQRAIAVKHVGRNEDWVAGHFPDDPMLPGVLMVEAAAQLACFLYNVSDAQSRLGLLLRVDEAHFRQPVRPGSDLLLLCQELRRDSRRFVTRVQGLVGQRAVFGARLTGILARATSRDIERRSLGAALSAAPQ